MGKLKILIIIGLLGFSLSSQALASENKRVVKNQKRLSHKIRKGVRTGKLTRTEAKNLRQDKLIIDNMRRRAKKDDGFIDRKELKEIKFAQNEIRKKINRKLQNKRVRFN